MSTVDQAPAAQFAALRAAGIGAATIVVDHASGAREDRPGLTRLLGELVEGDVLTVWKLERLGRSVSHLVNVVDDLGRRGVQFRSLTESLDTTSTAGRVCHRADGVRLPGGHPPAPVAAVDRRGERAGRTGPRLGSGTVRRPGGLPRPRRRGSRVSARTEPFRVLVKEHLARWCDLAGVAIPDLSGPVRQVRHNHTTGHPL